MGSDPIFDGAIAIENGEIIDVGHESDLLARYKNTSHEDYSHHVLMPGLINAHTHLDMTHHKNFPFDPVRTMGAHVNFVEWLLSCIDYKKSGSPDRFRSAIDEGLNTCVEAGTTCIGDMGSFEGIFQILHEAGVRAVVFPEILSYDSMVAKDHFETALAVVEKYIDYDSDLINVGIAPYSPYTLSRNILKIMAQHCRSSHLPIMLHAAESFSETEFFYNSTGDIASLLFPNIGWGENLPPSFHTTPVAYLDQINFLDSEPILVGCVNVTKNDIDRMANKGAKAVWCPRSNYYLKLAKAPIASMREKGIVTALGTDGISSTNTLSLWDELRFAFETIRQKKNGLASQDLLQMVTKDAATVLGIDDEVGTLETGKRADYIVVDIGDFPPRGDIYSHLIQHTKNYHIHKVAVNGQTIKRVN